MKNEEDEAFDELARRQGMWGGGFPAKRAMAADKLQDGKCKYCVDGCIACDARAQPAQEPVAGCVCRWDSEGDRVVTCERHQGWLEVIAEWADRARDAEKKLQALAQPAQQEALYGMNQDDWKDVVAAITKVRDGRGIYLGCRPADVFKDWFLALGTAKVKEKNND